MVIMTYATLSIGDMIAHDPFLYDPAVSTQLDGRGEAEGSYGWATPWQNSSDAGLAIAGDDNSLTYPATLPVTTLASAGSRVVQQDDFAASQRYLENPFTLNTNAFTDAYYLSFLVTRTTTDADIDVAFWADTQYKRWAVELNADGSVTVQAGTVTATSAAGLCVVGETYLVVSEFILANDTASIKLFPVGTPVNFLTKPLDWDATADGLSGLTMDNVVVTMASGEACIDELRIGTAYRDVVGAPCFTADTDLDNDGTTTALDLSQWLTAWLSNDLSPSYQSAYDFDMNDTIDLNDFSFVSNHWLANDTGIYIEAEDFQFHGDWIPDTSNKYYSGSGYLFGQPSGAEASAVTAIEIPADNPYRIWVRTLDFSSDPGVRRFRLSIDGTMLDETYADSGLDDWQWEDGGTYYLKKGKQLLAIHDLDKNYARVDAIMLLSDLEMIPDGTFGAQLPSKNGPALIDLTDEVYPFVALDFMETSAQPGATLANEHLKLEFVPVTHNGVNTFMMRPFVATDSGWLQVETDAGSEAYGVVHGTDTALIVDWRKQDPQWESSNMDFAIPTNGMTLHSKLIKQAVWSAGRPLRFLPKTVLQTGNKVTLTFHPEPEGTLNATWQLDAGQKYATLSMQFTPVAPGDYGLGYHSFFNKPLANITELLMPMRWNGKRLPDTCISSLDTIMPTPISMISFKQNDLDIVAGLTLDANAQPYVWPDPHKSKHCFMLRNLAGNAQPVMYSPVPGTPEAAADAGETVTATVQLLLTAADLYGGYRVVADDIFEVTDYRKNHANNLTETALNIIDLVMDDTYGGWWTEPKGPYQIEGENAVTHSTPMTYLSLYYLTGNNEIYRQRALPAMETVFAWNKAHFSNVPWATGYNHIGGYTGPRVGFGTMHFSQYYNMSKQFTPYYYDLATPGGDVIDISTAHNSGVFEDWLAHYLLTNDLGSLQAARIQADLYVNLPEPEDNKFTSFFLTGFLPQWQGLLWMYEHTGDANYLQGAMAGAKKLMPETWCYPKVSDQEITVHPDNAYIGDHGDSLLWKGAVRERLGFPRSPGDVSEHQVPRWQVSPIGLTWEQNRTYIRPDQAGRMINQTPWGPAFLRLAHYSDDETFATYARNAVVGRASNYPGYYNVGFTDLIQQADYPYVGPDVSLIYYHHIVPHLTWTIDYLVSEALYKSNGNINFPSQRQNGYAFFDNLIYGHKPGAVYGHENQWLWFSRDVVTVSNPQINYLLAHDETALQLILTNQNKQTESVTITFNDGVLGFDPIAVTTVDLIKNDIPAGTLPLVAGSVDITLAARELVVLTLQGCDIEVESHITHVPPQAGAYPGYSACASNTGEVGRGASIQMNPDAWDVYLWSPATVTQVTEVTFHYKIDGSWYQYTDDAYPYEFSKHMPDVNTRFLYYLSGVRADGQNFTTNSAVLGAM